MTQTQTPTDCGDLAARPGHPARTLPAVWGTRCSTWTPHQTPSPSGRPGTGASARRWLTRPSPKAAVVGRQAAFYTPTAPDVTQTAKRRIPTSRRRMPAYPRGLLESCAATSGTHGCEGRRRSNAPAQPDNRLHWIRDVTFAEDHCQIRTGHGQEVMATFRNLAVSLHRLHGATNIAAPCRRMSRDQDRALSPVR